MWNHFEKRTSAAEDVSTTKKLLKKIHDCKSLIAESPDVASHLEEALDQAMNRWVIKSFRRSGDLTDKGLDIMNIAMKMLYPEEDQVFELRREGYTKQHKNKNDFTDDANITGDEKGLVITYSTRINLENGLETLINTLENVLKLSENKPVVTKKLNSEDIHVIYAVKELKRLMGKYKVPTHKHVRYISDLITAVMKESCSEDRVRKLIA